MRLHETGQAPPFVTDLAKIDALDSARRRAQCATYILAFSLSIPGITDALEPTSSTRIDETISRRRFARSFASGFEPNPSRTASARCLRSRHPGRCGAQAISGSRRMCARTRERWIFDARADRHPDAVPHSCDSRTHPCSAFQGTRIRTCPKAKIDVEEVSV